MPILAAVVAVAAAGTAGTAFVGGLVTFGLATGIAASVIGGIVIGAVVGGITAAIMGGDILKGALAGGIVGGVTAGIGAWGAGAGAGAGAESMAVGDAITIPGEASIGAITETGITAGGTIAPAEQFAVDITTGNISIADTVSVTGSNVLKVGDASALVTASNNVAKVGDASALVTASNNVANINTGLVSSGAKVNTGLVSSGAKVTEAPGLLSNFIGAAKGTETGAQLIAQAGKQQMIGSVFQGVASGGAQMLQSGEAEDLAEDEYDRSKSKYQEGVSINAGRAVFKINSEDSAESSTNPSGASKTVKPYMTHKPKYVTAVPQGLLNKA